MNKDLSVSLGLSPHVLASFDDDDVIVLGMPWQRGHTLSIFSALCFSQREIRGARGLWLNSHLSPTPALPPSLPLCSPPLPPPLPVCHTLTPALALPYRALLSLACSTPCPHPSPFSCSVPFSPLLFTPFASLSPAAFSPSHFLCFTDENWGTGNQCACTGSFLFAYLVGLCMCAQRKIRKMNRGQLQQARNQ